MKLELTESAVKDLHHCLRYYEDQGVPEAGRRTVASLFKKIERLPRFPDSGRIVPEFSVPFLREVIDPPYRIVYRRDPAKIWVIRVWRSERPLRLD